MKAKALFYDYQDPRKPPVESRTNVTLSMILVSSYKYVVHIVEEDSRYRVRVDDRVYIESLFYWPDDFGAGSHEASVPLLTWDCKL